MSPGKARLLTGISCVGFLVLLSTAMLVLDIPELLSKSVGISPVNEFVASLGFFVLIAIMLLPFDLIGGFVIPRAFERQSLQLTSWFLRWFRSVIFQTVMFASLFFAYLQIGRELGPKWMIGLFILLQIFLVASQEQIWRLMTFQAWKRDRQNSTQFVTNRDQRFAGGITGFPGYERVLVPSSWQANLSTSSLNVLLERRWAAVQTGGRRRGIIAAAVWNIFCLSIAVFVSGSVVSNIGDLMTVFLCFLLLSFMGLLILPSLNRNSVFALDRSFADRFGKEDLIEALREIDDLTDQDRDRSVSEESIFQPIPCPERRIQSLREKGRHSIPAWNVARTALFLSWAFGGPLARAVHCNVGRPELWAMLPTD
ncbi:hypothetical protein OAF42_01475 [Planctomicrobium sp.]|nr:hypothetical protein [Planctomicrobium sp.]MDB4733091.1 hypothetical protein [Planctomicrobium sp.]MDB4793324.1 hypothetical protein [bacterium]